MEILDENWYFLLTYFKKENFFKNSLLFSEKIKITCINILKHYSTSCKYQE